MTTVEPGGGFSSLTDKQAAVLDLLADGRTSKEIATVLDLSESAVNRRIELLRSRFGGITCQTAFKRDPRLEWAPWAGQDHAADLTMSRACCCSNCAGLT